MHGISLSTTLTESEADYPNRTDRDLIAQAVPADRPNLQCLKGEARLQPKLLLRVTPINVFSGNGTTPWIISERPGPGGGKSQITV